jgi:AcrR family transcriptional regulator
MPRTPDPNLQQRIATAALRLLDEKGEQAVTMRAVAAAARTWTPTVYERFADRQALLAAVVDLWEQQLLAVMRSATGVEDLVEKFIRISCKYPRRFDLMADTFGARLAASAPQPGLEELKTRLREETSARGAVLDSLALAIASLVIGTTRAMIAAGPKRPRTRDLKNACFSALKLLLASY